MSRPVKDPAEKPLMAGKIAQKPARPASKRVRRTAEEARRLILDAAEERLARQGPEGLRLQEIASDTTLDAVLAATGATLTIAEPLGRF